MPVPGRACSVIGPGRACSVIGPGRAYSVIGPGRACSVIGPGRACSVVARPLRSPAGDRRSPQGSPATQGDEANVTKHTK